MGSELFSSDPDRLARFEREAKLLAALNHPNMAAIHGLDEVDTSTGSVRFHPWECPDTLSPAVSRIARPLQSLLFFLSGGCDAEKIRLDWVVRRFHSGRDGARAVGRRHVQRVGRAVFPARRSCRHLGWLQGGAHDMNSG